MSISHTITFSYTTSSGTINQTATITAEAEERQEVPIASDAADYEIDVHIPDGEVKAFIILADQNLSLEYNDATGTNGDITLTADVPHLWWEDAPWSLVNIMSYAGGAVNITKFFVTNDSDPATATTLYITTLYDATP